SYLYDRSRRKTQFHTSKVGGKRQETAERIVQKQSKVPKFGSWENGEVAYTACFEVARKGNGGGPIVNPNDIQMNRDVPHSAPPPNRPKANPKPQQQQIQPKFGAWDEGDDVPYTQVFEYKGRKANPNEPQMNRDVGPTQQHPKPPPKQHQPPPKFGAWEGGDEVPYTQIFENKSKPNPSEPQMNRDVGPTRQPKEPQPKPQVVKFVDNKPKQPPPAPRPQNDKKNVNVPIVANPPKHNTNNNRHNPPTHNNNYNRHTPTRPIKQQKDFAFEL
ncbi:hypothetical protein V2J09_016835, partial [Rumex salicifolius]